MAGSVTTEEKVEQLKQDSEVQKALDQAATPKEAVIIPAESNEGFPKFLLPLRNQRC